MIFGKMFHHLSPGFLQYRPTKIPSQRMLKVKRSNLSLSIYAKLDILPSFHLFEKEERWLLPNNLTFVKVVAECRSVSLLVFKTAFILSFLGDESHATILLFLSKS